MTFGTSHVLSTFIQDSWNGTQYQLGTGGTPNTFKIALFNNTTDSATASTDTLAHNTYLAAAGQFVTGNEEDGGSWGAGGYSLVAPTTSFASSGTALFNWTATNVSQATTTISTAFYGGAIYDSTNSSKVLCMIAFGGSYTVGGGTLAINWGTNSNAAASIFYITI